MLYFILKHSAEADELLGTRQIQGCGGFFTFLGKGVSSKAECIALKEEILSLSIFNFVSVLQKIRFSSIPTDSSTEMQFL